jgi:hypothetical protein
MNHRWLRDLQKNLNPEQFTQLLPDTLLDIYESCGMDILISLLDNLPSIPISVSPRSLPAGVGAADLSGMSRRKLLKVLPDTMRYIYERCGLGALMALLREFPGMEVYIAPQSLDAARTAYIRKYFDGKNARELALTLEVSLRYIYKELERQSEPKNTPVAYTPRLPFVGAD